MNYSYNPSAISQNNADIEEAKETLEILYDINQILNCGLDRQQLSVLISLCENGINPEALAAVVKELRKEAAALKAMSDNRQKVETVTKFPEGDLYNNYDPNDNPEKFEYLKAKYVFRFPFTITSIKWGLALGSIFGIHNYIKTRKASNAAYWFVWGSVLTALPIWGFFMFKYSFYTMTLRKFEVDQYQNIEDSHLIKEYMMYKTGTYDPTIKDEQLVKKLEKISQQAYRKHSQLDDLLQNMNDEEFELVPVQKTNPIQTDSNINENLDSIASSKLQKQ
ncbi:hypothetical protein ABPG74_004955 [Tetrahymena malaccensis]